MGCLIILFCAALVQEGEASVDQVPLMDDIEKSVVQNSHAHESDAPADQLGGDSWIDRWQSNLTDSMDYTVRQLDSFFALKGSDAYKDARAEGRVQLGWEPRSRDLTEVDLRFRIRVKLPALENRVDLMLSDDEDYDDEDTIKAAREPGRSRRNSTTLALRFRNNEDSHFSYRIGAGRRDQLYVKSRFEDTVAFNAAWAMRYDAELYFYTRDQLGGEVGASFQYVGTADHVFRFNNRYYYRDKSNDWMWRHEAQFLQPLTNNSAAIYTLFTEGLTQPDYRLGEVYTSVRWRTNPLREWLFFEVEPFVLWLRREEFKPSYGMALRVEVYYGKDY